LHGHLHHFGVVGGCVAYLVRLIVAGLLAAACSSSFAVIPSVIKWAWFDDGWSGSYSFASGAAACTADVAAKNAGTYSATFTSYTAVSDIYGQCRYNFTRISDGWTTARVGDMRGSAVCPTNSVLTGGSCVCSAGFPENAAHTACEASACPQGNAASATIGLGWFTYGDVKSMYAASKQMVCLANGSASCFADVVGTAFIPGAKSGNNVSVTATVSGSLTGATCTNPTPAYVTAAPPPCVGQSGLVNGLSVCISTGSPSSAPTAAAAAAAAAASTAADVAQTAGATAANVQAAATAAGAASATTTAAGFSAVAAAAAAVAAGASAQAGNSPAVAAAAGAKAAATVDSAAAMSANPFAATAGTPSTASASSISAASSSISTGASNAAQAAVTSALTAGKSPADAAVAGKAASDAYVTKALADSQLAYNAKMNDMSATFATQQARIDSANAAAAASAANATNQANATKAAVDAQASRLAQMQAALDKLSNPSNAMEQFCAANPESPMCKKVADSSFSGACGSAPTCSGDAVMCAIAQATFDQDCLLNKSTPESDLYSTKKALTGSQVDSLPGNSTVTISSGSFSQADLIGGGSGLSNLNVSVWGKSVSLPLSDLNIWFSRLGSILVAVTFLLCARIVTRG
jgi:hypothetical protein